MGPDVTESGELVRTCDVLGWDSAFFRYRIARFRGSVCSSADAAAIMRECTADGIDCVYVLVDGSDTPSIDALLAHRAYLADVRVTFGMEIRDMTGSAVDTGGGVRPGVVSEGGVRPAVASDIPALKRIAAVSHRDTRFYADKHFSPKDCDRLYQVWIEKSCQGYADAVFVAADDAGDPAGYVTCHRDEGHPAGETGRIGLFAVREDVRGRGLATRLLRAARGWFSANRLTSMTVTTQVRNVRALQFYGRAGLVIRGVKFCFHFWPRDDSA